MTSMKWLGFVLILLGSPAVALAQPTWTIDLIWSAQADAISYNVDKSTDMGVTWANVAKPTTNTYKYTGTDLAHTCFRISACNNNGCTIRVSDFACHDQSKQLPVVPTNIGAK